VKRYEIDIDIHFILKNKDLFLRTTFFFVDKYNKNVTIAQTEKHEV